MPTTPNTYSIAWSFNDLAIIRAPSMFAQPRPHESAVAVALAASWKFFGYKNKILTHFVEVREKLCHHWRLS